MLRPQPFGAGGNAAVRVRQTLDEPRTPLRVESSDKALERHLSRALKGHKKPRGARPVDFERAPAPRDFARDF